MKYLKEFSTNAEYETYISNTNYLPNVSLVDEDGKVKYKRKNKNADKYLTFVALEDGTFKFKNKGSGNNLQYSLDDGNTWTSLPTNTHTPTIHQGEKIMWKGQRTPTANNGIGCFSATGRFDIEGNVMSLLFGDNFRGQTSLSGYNDAFYNLFQSTQVISAENLSLPATTLSSSCYWHMFGMCGSLTTAPELPATTLVQDCYHYMFWHCGALNYIKMLATDTSASGCLGDWVSSVSATGTFVKAASATLPRGKSGIPSGWEVINE